jgi:hypothetical protein
MKAERERIIDQGHCCIKFGHGTPNSKCMHLLEMHFAVGPSMLKQACGAISSVTERD